MYRSLQLSLVADLLYIQDKGSAPWCPLFIYQGSRAYWLIHKSHCSRVVSYMVSSWSQTNLTACFSQSPTLRPEHNMLFLSHSAILSISPNYSSTCTNYSFNTCHYSQVISYKQKCTIYTMNTVYNNVNNDSTWTSNLVYMTIDVVYTDHKCP